MADTCTNEPFAIDARMEQVLGKPQRIQPLAQDDLTPEQIELIEAIRAGAGAQPADEFPEFFLTVVKHPRLFKCQMEAGTMYFTGTIPPRERELAILRIGWLCGAPYEWGEHVNIGKRNGLTTEEIERTTKGSSAPGWSDHEAAVLRGVEELLDDKMISDGTWDTLAMSWSEEQLMEFPMLVGAYVSTAFQQNSLRMRLSPHNPGLRGR